MTSQLETFAREIDSIDANLWPLESKVALTQTNLQKGGQSYSFVS